MRKTICLVPVLLLAFVLQAQSAAFLSHLTTLRDAIAAHRDALESEGGADPKLISALNKAIASIEKPGATNLATDLKVLASVSTGIAKTSAAAELTPALDAALAAYIDVLSQNADSTSDRLSGAFPSGPRNGAEKNLSQVYDYLANAEENGSLAAAAKLLSKAVTKLRAADTLTTRALAVPPPAASFTAEVTASEEGSFKFTPYPKEAVQGVRDNVLGNIVITATYVKPGKITQSRTINIVLPNVPEGTTTYNLVSGGSALAMYVTQRSQITLNPPGATVLFAESYLASSGTVTITRNAASRTGFGTFEFSGPGGNDDSRSVSVSGSFSFTHN